MAARTRLSDFDRRHTFVATAVYRLPFGGVAQSRWLHALVAGWQINSMLKLYSGTPLTPQVNSFNYDSGEAKRPDRIGPGTLPNPTPDMWFNVTDFVRIPTGSYRFGNSGRNILIGPGRGVWDCSLMRYFTMPREHKLQLRWELFNALNHPNFNMPQKQIDVPTAGVISAAMSGRQMQAALRYIF